MTTTPAVAEVVSESIAVRPAGPSLESLAESFASFVDASPVTVECYARNVRLFMEWLGDNKISRPTASDVLAYKRHLVATKAPATVSARISAVRAFFKWTDTLPEGEGHYPNIASGIKGAKQNRGHSKDAFTPRQVRRILDEAHGETVEALREYALLSLLFTTGIRAVEASRADVADFRPRGDSMVLYVQGKGRTSKTDFVKIAPKVEDAIRAYLVARGPLPQTAPLFVSLSNNSRGERLPANTIGRILKKAFRDAGFDSPYWVGHSTRVTAATEALIKGNSIFEVQRLLRHADTKTTEIYLRGLERLGSRCEADLEASFM